MSDWRTLSVALRADVANYQRNMDSAASSTDKVGKSWLSTSKLAKAGVAAIGVAAVALVNSSIKYQTAMLNVQSLGTETDASMKRLSASVLDLSTKLPQSAQTLAEGLYDIESSGFAGSAALTVLQASAKAASAGLSDTATSARAITGVLNAYGLGADHAREVSDVLFQTVNSGVISFQELAQNLGDVVPMAAAMGISLQQVTGALATMTLAGLPAAEAATATARVMQAFIKPSAGMATEMARLGITLDDLKNPAFGLSGAMQAIAKDTDGSTVALQSMFPDVRSLKGALALTSAEGKTYARVMRDEAKATDGAGATQRAFAIQMQGLGAQLEIAKNKGMAFFLALSVQVIPVVQRLAGEIGDGLVSAGNALAPVWDDLFSTGKSVVQILGELWDGIGPVVEGFGMLAGGAAVGGLRVVAGLLDDLTGLLARNAALVEMVGGAFLAWKAAQIIGGVITSLGETIYLYGLTAASSVASARTQVAAATSTRVSVMLTTGALTKMAGAWLAALGPTALIAAAIVGVGVAFKGLSDAKKHADALVSSIDKMGSSHSIETLNTQLDRNQRELDKATKGADAYGHGWKATFIGAYQMVTPAKNMVAEYGQSVDKLRAQQERLQAQQERVGDATDRLSYNYGLTRGAVELYLESDKNLNLKTATTKQIHDSLVGTLGRMAKATGLTKSQVQDLSGALVSSGMSLDDFSKGLGDAQQKASDAITSFGDLATHKFDFGDAKDHILNADDIRKFYSDTLTETATFTNGISTLIQQGYDPNLVSRLLQQGPETAGPAVKALVSGYSKDLVGYVNDAEQQISKLSNQAAESARLAYLATTSNSDRMSSELANAQAIVQAKFAGMSSVDIAAKLGLEPKDFNRIVADFGITVDKLNAAGGKVKPVPLKADPRDFDRDFGRAQLLLNMWGNGDHRAVVRVELDKLLGDKRIADRLLGDLTKKRKADVRAGATNTAETDRELAYIARDRSSKIWVDANFDAATYNLQMYGAKVAAVIAAQNFVGGTIFATPSQGGGLSPGGQRGLYGGIASFAQGGVTGRQIIKFGEPSTGGEAFVPRLGISQARAASILDVAASWHDLAVTPKAKAAPFTPSTGSGVTIIVQAPVTVDASGAGSPAQVGAQVAAAMDRWVQQNPRKIIAAVGGHAARTGKV